MDWEIFSFLRAGPIQFGMSPDQVAELFGPPLRTRQNGIGRRETRSLDLPIIRYVNDRVSEIEFFRDIEQLVFGEIALFREPGPLVMRRLAELNGGAEEAVGIVLFRNLGLTTGRLDEGVTGEHSVTAFAEGLWDHDTDFKPIAF